MFERLQARARRSAEALAARRRTLIMERLAADLPQGIAVEQDSDGARLSGRGLRRRLALDPALRALLGTLR
jgi:hypothetical protein